MLFRGRTVLAFLLIAITGTALATLTVADRLIQPPGAQSGGAARTSAAGSDREGLSDSEIGKLDAVFALIRDNYYKAADRAKLVDGALAGMVNALGDPYSVYMEKETAQQLSQTVAGSFTGIGAEVELQNGRVVVVAAMKGTPAERAGLQPKDIVTQVNGDKLEGLELTEAVAKIRGPKGTKARLLIQRAGVATPIQLILVRDDIDVETVTAKLLPDGIGLIEIRQFSLNTYDRFAEELKLLEEQGLKGLVVDVRNNPGGVLEVAQLVAQTFVPEGKPLFWIEDRDGKRKEANSQGGGKAYPVSVIINEGSASAAEVLAGAVSESGGGILVGGTSFGKGTVQISYGKVTGDGSQVKMTIAKWLTPDGSWIHEKGIDPDLRVDQPDYFTVARIAKDKTLQPDTMGEDVRSLQIMLDAVGETPDRTDGYFSEATRLALVSYQQKAGLPATGVCDPATAEALEEDVIAMVRDEANDRQLAEAVAAVKARLSAGDAAADGAAAGAGGASGADAPEKTFPRE